MRNKRRRIFYIDRVFQKKLMLLFLGLNLAVVAANIAYYFIHLKGAVEENMFRSHIVISNVTDVMAGNVIRFNLLLAVVCLLLVLVFYTFTRVKLKAFFDKIQKALYSRQESTQEEPYRFKIAQEFQDIDQVLGDFLNKVDSTLDQEELKLSNIRNVTHRHQADKTDQ
jgi:uncharacterized paraquat-inducible protein A